MQLLVGHAKLRGWCGAQGSQGSWVGQMLYSPPPVPGAGAVRGAWEHQSWGWRGTQGSQRRRAGLGHQPPLRLVGTEAGSGMLWRATVAARPGSCGARRVTEWPLGGPWAPAEAGDHGRSGPVHRRKESAHS